MVLPHASFIAFEFRFEEVFHVLDKLAEQLVFGELKESPLAQSSSMAALYITGIKVVWGFMK